MKKNKFDFLLWNWRNFVISAIVFILVFFYRNRMIKVIFEPIGLYPLIYYVFLIGIFLYWIVMLVYSFGIKKLKIKKSKKTNLFLLSWKKTGIALMIFVGAVVIHNLVYAFALGVFGIEFEEPVFFIIAVFGVPLYFIVSIVYSLIKKLRRRK